METAEETVAREERVRIIIALLGEGEAGVRPGAPHQRREPRRGCPECTLTAWLHRGRAPTARVHDAVVQTEQVDLGQVQADELSVKVCKGCGGDRCAERARDGLRDRLVISSRGGEVAPS
jgi:hypothetical protein